VEFRLYEIVRYLLGLYPAASPRGAKGAAARGSCSPQPAVDSIMRFAQIRWDVNT